MKKTGFNYFKQNTRAPFFLSTVRSSFTRGNKIVFKFTGDSVALISTTGSNRSRAKVFVDGEHVKTIDTHSATTKHR